jgi:putative acetyltransferase
VHNAARTWYAFSPRAISSGGERLLHTQEVDGSNPSLPTIFCLACAVTETRDSKRLDGVAAVPGDRPPNATVAAQTLQPPPHDVVVRPATPADLPAIMAMVRAAFGYDLEARLIERLERERRVTASVVAVCGSGVVGHALLSRVDLTAPDSASRPALALAPVAVAPDHQGRGIGRLVVQTCVRLADPRLPIFVIGDPAFYRRFGFESAGPHGVRQRFEVAPGHFMVRLADTAPADDVERTLDYPAAFDGC